MKMNNVGKVFFPKLHILRYSVEEERSQWPCVFADYQKKKQRKSGESCVFPFSSKMEITFRL